MSRLLRDRLSGRKLAQTKVVSSRSRRKSLGEFEALEQRLVLAQIVWTGAAGDNSFQNANNWENATNTSIHAVPGSADDATINVSGNPTIVFNGTSTVHSLVDDDSLNITGGTLTLTSGASQVAGSLTVAPGATLIINGAGASFADGSATTINAANLYAEGGATLTLAAATSDAGSSSTSTVIEATGRGTGTASAINLPNVTSLTGGTNNNIFYIYAESGGKLSLPNVASDPTGAPTSSPTAPPTGPAASSTSPSSPGSTATRATPPRWWRPTAARSSTPS